MFRIVCCICGKSEHIVQGKDGATERGDTPQISLLTTDCDNFILGFECNHCGYKVEEVEGEEC